MWDVYSRGVPGSLDNPGADTPDMTLNVDADYEIENMRWANTAYQLYTTMKSVSKADDYILSVYDVPDGVNGVTATNQVTEDSGRVSKVKKTAKNQQSSISATKTTAVN